MRQATLKTNVMILLVLGLVAAAIVAAASGSDRPSVAIDGIEALAERGGGPTLEALPVVERLVLSAAEFHPSPGQGFAATLNRAGNQCLESTGFTLAASNLELPHGAEVVGQEVSVFDDTAGGSNVVFQVLAQSQVDGTAPAEPTFSIILQVTSTGEGDGSGWQLLEDTDAFTIDNDTRAYPIEVALTQAGLQFCSAVIEYIPPSSGGLIFHPLPPCAVFDTRPDLGGREAPLAPGETMDFDLQLTDYSAQGGVAADCGVPPVAQVDSPDGAQAVLVNLVALDPAGSGNFKAWDIDETEPPGGVLVFEADSNTNAYVPIGQTGAGEDDMLTRFLNNSVTSTHIRGVVVGYFTAP